MDVTLQEKQSDRLEIINAYIHRRPLNNKLIPDYKYVKVLLEYITKRLKKYCNSDSKYYLEKEDILTIVDDCFDDLNNNYDKTKPLENYLNYIIRNKAHYYQAEKESAETGLSMNRIMKVLPEFRKNYEDIDMKYHNESVASKLKLYSDKYSIKLSTVEGYYNDSYKHNSNKVIEKSEDYDSYGSHSDKYFEEDQKTEQYNKLDAISNCVMSSSENYWINHKSTEYFSVLETCFIFTKIDESFRSFYKQLMKLFSYNFINSHCYNLFRKNEKLPNQKEIGSKFKKTTVSVDTSNYKRYLRNEIKLIKEV